MCEYNLMKTTAYGLNRREIIISLADIDRQAHERLFLLTKQFAEQENATEQLRADNSMLWVQKMNEIQSRVREIICSEIIYA